MTQRRQALPGPALLLLLAGLSLTAPLGCRHEPASVVVVVASEAGSPSEDAGFRPADRILSWAQNDIEREVDSALQLRLVETAVAPRGPIVVTLRRGWRTLEKTLPAAPWGLTVRPGLPPAWDKIDRRGRDQPGTSRLMAWRELIGELEPAARIEDAAWYHLLAARWLGQAGDWRASGEHYRAIVLDDPNLEALVHLEYARLLIEGGQDQAAELALRGARSLATTSRTSSAALALSASDPAFLAAIELEEARLALRGGQDEPESLAAALATLEELGGRGGELARAWELRAGFATGANDLESAVDAYSKARDLRETALPHDASTASSRLNLGLVQRRRGDLAAAIASLEQARDLARARDPAAASTAIAHDLLGQALIERGDFAAARTELSRAQSILAAEAGDSAAAARALDHLAQAAALGGDTESELRYRQRAAEILQRTAPASAELLGQLERLGAAAVRLDRGALAQPILEQALALSERGHQSLIEARLLLLLGAVERERGSPARARAYFERALERVPGRPGQLVEQVEAQLALVSVSDPVSDPDRRESAAETWRRATDWLQSAPSRSLIDLPGRVDLQWWLRDAGRAEVAALAELDRADRALETLERSLRLQLDLMAWRRDPWPDEPDASVRQLRTLEHDLGRLRAQWERHDRLDVAAGEVLAQTYGAIGERWQSLQQENPSLFEAARPSSALPALDSAKEGELWLGASIDAPPARSGVHLLLRNADGTFAQAHVAVDANQLAGGEDNALALLDHAIQRLLGNGPAPRSVLLVLDPDLPTEPFSAALSSAGVAAPATRFAAP